MENKMKNEIPLTYLTGLLIVLSLAYYFGYIYGLGMSPSSLPLTVLDISNGIVTHLPLTLATMIITIWLFKIPKVLQNTTGEKNIEKKSHIARMYYSIKPYMLGILLFIVMTKIAYSGTTLPLYWIGLWIFIALIQSLHEPNWIPAYFINLFKLMIIIIALIFSFGFTSGYFKFYSTKNLQIVTLINSEIYYGDILIYFTSGILMKNNKKILFFNNSLLRSIEFQPSKSYLEAKNIKDKY
jgi:hypothetical protein